MNTLSDMHVTNALDVPQRPLPESVCRALENKKIAALLLAIHQVVAV